VGLRAALAVEPLEVRIVPAPTISGQKFEDLNGNGVRDSGEPGVAGITIDLDRGANGTLDHDGRTDANGNFNFNHINLQTATYRIRERLPAGWVQTTPNPPDFNVNSNSNTNHSFTFGNFRLISISGTKFHDLDGDGFRDNNEPGLQGVTIQLDLGANGSVDQTTTTDNNGNYSFSNVGPGTHRVREVVPPGFQQTTNDPNDINARSGTNVSNVNFGNRQTPTTGSISGHKFHDRDGDGVKDNNEPGLQGVTIELDAGANGSVNQTTTTDNNGNYSFTNLVAGTYRVREVVPGGWTQTTGNPNDITLGSGNNVSGVDFGNFRLITISGTKFEDLDGDGNRDNNEPGLQGVTIELDLGANGSVNRTTTTDNNGNFSFSNVGPGTHRVREVVPSGWTQTTNNPGDIDAFSGIDATGVDFGNRRTTGSISGHKFHDRDGDGVKDNNEPGLQGVTIELDIGANGSVNRTTTTDNNGNYSFSNLSPGDYRVREVVPGGWTQTTNNPGDITLNGNNVSGVDFGNFQLITISGTKFEDLDGDGNRDSGEPGVEGVTIQLDLGANGSVNRTTTTDNNGNFSFSNVGPGTHRLSEVVPAGWTQTSGPGDIDAFSGIDATNKNFGNRRTATGRISGQKFHDRDGDGVRDNNEPGLGGVTIELDIGANGSVNQTTTTDDNGNYSFSNLSPGEYRVREVVQSGWTQTTNNPGDITLNGNNVSGVDFGNFQLITIRGTKFEDLDADAFRDPGEPGLQGVTIELDLGANGSVNRTATTDNNGNYSFTNVGPGTHRVREVVPPGFQQTTPNPNDIDARSGIDANNVDFGNNRPGAGVGAEIRGTVFEDLNANGARNGSEPGLSGITVFLDLNNNDVLDQTLITASSTNVPRSIPDRGTTQSSLNVSGFSGRLSDVNVTLTINHSWDEDLDVFLVSPNGTRIELFTDVGGNGDHFVRTTLDDEALQAITGGLAPFTGSFRPEGSLAALDGQDPNGTWTLEVSDDAQFDTGTLQNWSLTLTTSEPTTVTDSNGNFSFLNLPAGTFNVIALLPPGVVQTVPGGPGFKHTVSLNTNQVVTGRDFGLVRLAEIHGVKYEDVNGNGNQNGTEPGLAGWVIYLDQNDNGVLDSNGVTVNSTDVPRSIPDEDTVNSQLTVNKQTGVILDVNVRLNISHANANHLDVFLVSPNGTRVELFTDVGGSGNNFNNTTLDDEAGNAITQGSAPFNGSFRPEGQLSALDFQNPNGVWTLEITDDTNGTSGTLNSWSLIFTLAAETTTQTDADGAYAFTNLFPGSYNVREVLQAGWTQTEPGGPDFKYRVSLNSGDVVTDRDFGNRRQTGGQIGDPLGGNPDDTNGTKGVAVLLASEEAPTGGQAQQDLTTQTGSFSRSTRPAPAAVDSAPSLTPEAVDEVFAFGAQQQPDDDDALIDALFGEDELEVQLSA
jgi:subtilisin-like proprotein convertase family protein/protocatechuate 3,4-dioxygenase beta subunit